MCGTISSDTRRHVQKHLPMLWCGGCVRPLQGNSTVRGGDETSGTTQHNHVQRHYDCSIADPQTRQGTQRETLTRTWFPIDAANGMHLCMVPCFAKNSYKAYIAFEIESQAANGSCSPSHLCNHTICTHSCGHQPDATAPPTLHAGATAHLHPLSFSEHWPSEKTLSFSEFNWP